MAASVCYFWLLGIMLLSRFTRDRLVICPRQTSLFRCLSLQIAAILSLALAMAVAGVCSRAICLTGYALLQIDHPFDRCSGAQGNRSIDRDLLTQLQQAVEDVGERDPLHVRTKVAGLH